jgi:tetratricopeptide (TPR) repeat protein
MNEPHPEPSLDERFAALRQARDDDRVEQRRQAVEAALLGPRPAPRRFGRFIELQALGRGGMGEVYEAYDPTLDRKVAIKLVRRDMTRHHRRLEREAMALARLQHPNVVQIYEVGRLDDRLFLAMELIEGQTLHAWQHASHGWRECVDAYLDAGRGLAAAHDAGLIHRDFKPANCIRDACGRVRVLDFGLVRATEARPGAGHTGRVVATDDPSPTDDGPSSRREQPTETGSPVGTKAYMAPECFTAQASEKSDQYAFCVALHEALHGRRPADDHLRRASPLPAASVPRWLQRAVERGMHEDPAQRWPSMHALLAVLERGRRQRRAWAGGVSLVATGLAGLAVGMWWPAACEPPREALAGTWNAAQRQRVRDAIYDTAVPYADDTWALVEPALDRHVQAWVQASVEVCETSTRQSEPPEVTERRRACLRHGLAALRQTVELLASADAELADHAVDVVAGLPAIERCAAVDPPWQPPRPAALEQEVELLREELVRARLLEIAGQYEQGLELVAPVLARAGVLADGPLRAEALQVQGQLQLSAGDHALAEEDLGQAFEEATKLGLAEVELEALSGLIYVLGVAETYPDAARWLGVRARALLEASPTTDAVLAADVLTSIAQVDTVRRDLESARGGFERALAVLGEREREAQLALVRPLEGLAQLERREGRLDRALELYQRTVEIRERWLGPHHPATAHSLISLCGALSRAEPDDAAAVCQRAIDILGEQPSPDHGWLGHAHHTLALARYEQGRLPAAETELRLALEALALDRKGDGASHPHLPAVRRSLERVRAEQARLP